MQLLFHLVYYHPTCFGHGSCPSPEDGHEPCPKHVEW